MSGQTIILKKSKNHIYETGESFAVIAAGRRGKPPLVTVEFFRDIAEAAEGPITPDDESIQVTRLNFATISMDTNSIKDLIGALKDVVKNVEETRNTTEEAG